MEEMDEQILEAADALRADMISREQEKKKSFCKGAAIGVLSTLALCLLVFFVIPYATLMISEKRDTVTGPIGSAQSEAEQTQPKELLDSTTKNKLDALSQIIDYYYYEDVDNAALQEGLYKGLFSGIGDIYSAYYTAEEYNDLEVSALASLSGIGTVLQQDPDTMQVSIVRVYDDTPAQKAGLRAGDIIVQVDDIVCTTMELTELVTHIRGEAGSHVKLKVYREGATAYEDYDVVRAKIDLPTVSGQMLEDGVGYILIAEFGTGTVKEFTKTYEELKSKGMTSLVIDLRDNPGGLMDSATEILDMFLPEGVLVWTEDKRGNKKEYKSDAKSIDIPMVVLVNENSASSSEIFAGAMKDYKYATLLGTKTFGKGVVQSLRKLADGSAIKLTIAKYYTPSGNCIHGTGIEPDVKLEFKYLGDLDKRYDLMQDNQVLKAIEILNE